MRALGSPVISALGSPSVAIVQLIELSFALPIRLNTSTWNLVYGGNTYQGAAGMGTVTPIQDSPGEIKGLNFQLIGLDSNYIGLALDDANVVQGTPVTIRTAILNSSYAIVDAPIEWTGKLDTMSIEEDGETCTISVTAESSAVDLLRGNPLTYSHADQTSISPTDRAFEYVIPQANEPAVVWPDKVWLQLSAQLK